MTAKEKLLRLAPSWSEEQTERALRAAEGGQAGDSASTFAAIVPLLDRAAALRARQPRSVDVAELLHEARDELDRRAG